MSLKKIVYCWALRLIGCEKFDRSQGFLGRLCVWGGNASRKNNRSPFRVRLDTGCLVEPWEIF